MRRATTDEDLAAALAAWIHDALPAPGRFAGLAVGESTLPLYASLPVDGWGDRVIVPVDELVPAPSDPGRAFEARLRLALPAQLRPRVEPLPDGTDDVLAAQGLCLLVLGLGPDGHLAFNQPGTSAHARSRVVEIAPHNLARLGDVAPATHALTMGIGTILSANRIALVVSGRDKSHALHRVLEGPEGPDVPASFLRRHNAVTVFVGDDD